jgi:spermidine/putrescine ABC transporter ATP-binding subunit
MTAGAPIIEIRDVTKRFGPVTAVDSVSLAIKENEFFALLGPSGCGKTTLLRLIAGFESPDAGRILLDGADLDRVRPNRRPINMMFQSYALFPHLSVRANVAYGLRMEGVARAEIERRVGEALEMVHLQDVAERRPERLSGGQRQRVALARALIKRPRLLLLDEPLAALDRKLRAQMQFELKKLQHEVGISFLVVTHDQEEALAMADRIALLDHGRLAQVGAARELYENPANRFVAGFIGSMNFFHGTAVEGGTEVPGLGLLRGDTGAARPGAAVVLVVRPEKIALHPTRPADPELNVVAGRLEGSTYLGQDLSVFVRIEGRPDPLVLRLTSDCSAAMDLSEGTEIWCSWPAGASRILMD